MEFFATLFNDFPSQISFVNTEPFVLDIKKPTECLYSSLAYALNSNILQTYIIGRLQLFRYRPVGSPIRIPRLSR